MRLYPKIKILFRAVKTVKNWFVYFADYLGFVRGRTVVYRLFGGTLFAVRGGTNDRVLFNQVWLSRGYSPAGFEIQPGDTVIDIGAHVGFFSVFAARKAKRGRVYSFEPAPQNFALLQKNVALNGIKNIVLHQAAVSRSRGEKDFILYQGSTGAHSFLYS